MTANLRISVDSPKKVRVYGNLNRPRAHV
jgi:hypothetical protein